MCGRLAVIGRTEEHQITAGKPVQEKHTDLLLHVTRLSGCRSERIKMSFFKS